MGQLARKRQMQGSRWITCSSDDVPIDAHVDLWRRRIDGNAQVSCLEMMSREAQELLGVCGVVMSSEYDI
jgi:hypothetical protein